jgi:L-lactate dehydrogenase
VLIEALTGGLSGFGRADPPAGWGATVFMSLYDPSAFGGEQDFRRQMDHIAASCRNNPPRPGVGQVRMPGDRGMQRRAEQMAQAWRCIRPLRPCCARAPPPTVWSFPPP